MTETLDATEATVADALDRVSAVLEQQPPAIRALVLESVPLGDAGAQALSGLLAGGPPGLSRLAELHVNFCGIGPAGGRALLRQQLPAGRPLRVLNLEGNSLGDDGAAAAAAVLGAAPLLEALDLCGNGVGDRGAAALGDALRGHVALRQLFLRDNAIGDGGAQALAEALSHPGASLEELHLVGNRFGADGAAALAAALRASGALRVLDVGRNPRVGDAGGMALLMASGGLKELRLYGCGLSAAGEAALVEAASSKPEGFELTLH